MNNTSDNNIDINQKTGATDDVSNSLDSEKNIEYTEEIENGLNQDTGSGAKNPDDSNQDPLDEDIDFIDEDTENDQGGLIKKLRAKLNEAVQTKQEYLTNWQKDKAEFINARKRDEEEKQNLLKYAGQNVIEDILPVLDSFDMAMSNKDSWEGVSKEWRAGVEGIRNQLLAVLQKYSVTVFGETEEVFDPNKHHSVSVVQTEDKNLDGKVALVLQKGYEMKGKIIRPALVQVYEV